MPYISFRTNLKITEDKEKTIKEKIGKSIEILPGKKENWLMICFQDECKLYFGGKNDSPMAYIEVNLYGASTKTAYNALTMTITKIINDELGISSDKIYVKYEEAENWGWNGANF